MIHTLLHLAGRCRSLSIHMTPTCLCHTKHSDQRDNDSHTDTQAMAQRLCLYIALDMHVSDPMIHKMAATATATPTQSRTLTHTETEASFLLKSHEQIGYRI